MVSTIIKDIPVSLRFNVAVSQFAREGFARFGVSKGGTYSEYYAGARMILKRDKALINEYYQEWKEERQKDIIAYNNIVSQLDDAVEDSLAFIGEEKRWLISHVRDAWHNLKDMLESVTQSQAVAMGQYYREGNNYRKLEQFIFSSIYGSSIEEIAERNKRGSRLLKNIIHAFSVSFSSRSSAVLSAMQAVSNMFEEVEE